MNRTDGYTHNNGYQATTKSLPWARWSEKSKMIYQCVMTIIPHPLFLEFSTKIQIQNNADSFSNEYDLPYHMWFYQIFHWFLWGCVQVYLLDVSSQGYLGTEHPAICLLQTDHSERVNNLILYVNCLYISMLPSHYTCIIYYACLLA